MKQFIYDIPIEEIANFIQLDYETQSYHEAMKFAMSTESVETFRSKWVESRLAFLKENDRLLRLYADKGDFNLSIDDFSFQIKPLGNSAVIKVFEERDDYPKNDNDH